jgi:hypothetical protein
VGCGGLKRLGALVWRVGSGADLMKGGWEHGPACLCRANGIKDGLGAAALSARLL